MVISLRKWLCSIRLLIVFLGLSLLFYKAIHWLDAWVFPADKYGTPQGAAVKAFVHDGGFKPEGGTVIDRLRTFYWYGE
ncbi:DUF4227 family protein [Paenibacillus tuaregi]|uniref:DUF4227 family protein n=1 Tax=Paenibacillus tuaregi TaxID=1816681 RepID=UPI000837D856|nr:DUF4227 family protein [Paenibacillus tuaregi]